MRGAGFDFVAGDFEGRTFDEKEVMFGASAVTTAQNRARYQQVLATREAARVRGSHADAEGHFLRPHHHHADPRRDGAVRFLPLQLAGCLGPRVGRSRRSASRRKILEGLRASPDAISVHDMASGCFVDANLGLLRMFGYAREEVIGRTATELGLWVHNAEREDFIKTLRREGTVRDRTISMRTRQGEIRQCELSAEVVEIGGRSHNVSVLRDVTESQRTHAALRENRRLLATLLDNLPGMSYRSRNDRQWTMEFCQRRQPRTHRLRAGRPDRQPARGFRRPDRRGGPPGVWDEVQAALRARRHFEIIYRIRRADGGLGWMWERGQGVFAEGTEPVAIEGFITDITARKGMEEALRESEDRFSSAFRASPDIIVISDYETGEYLEVNAAQENCFGYTREELIGRKPGELGFVHDCAVQDEIKQRLERDGHVRDMKVQGQTRDGRPITVSMSAEIIMVGGRKCMLRVSRDVTLATQAEQALLESEEKFGKAFRSSPSPLTITEVATGRYLEVNTGFERVTGFRREDVIGRTSLEVGIWENPPTGMKWSGACRALARYGMWNFVFGAARATA